MEESHTAAELLQNGFMEVTNIERKSPVTVGPPSPDPNEPFSPWMLSPTSQVLCAHTPSRTCMVGDWEGGIQHMGLIAYLRLFGRIWVRKSILRGRVAAFRALELGA